jgi:2-oxoglutarate ferredoxin oxidoreductase subunit gamma
MIDRLGHAEIRFAGSGGQGIILMGIILAYAAANDQRRVVQTQSYGPEARGGHVRSDVIISTEPIDYPEATSLDVLLALSAEAGRHHLPRLKPDGILMFDSDKAAGLGEARQRTFAIPFARLATETTGNVQTANILSLGALTQATKVVSVPSLEKAVARLLPRRVLDLNLTALQAGLAAGCAPLDA